MVFYIYGYIFIGAYDVSINMNIFGNNRHPIIGIAIASIDIVYMDNGEFGGLLIE
jgi:2-keto-3-deoxy-L-rhamnonate aldolase RhmA